jgi:predicted HTH transcriptional regulator
VNLGKENEQQEFKLGLAQLDKGLKSLSAMLNLQQKGTVYFGVDDDGTVKGIEIGKNTLLDIRSRAAELIEPRIILNIDDLKDENGLTYIRVFAEGSDIPYSCDGRYYIRTASADEQIGSDLLRKMLISGNTDMLIQITSENQDLSFDGLIHVLKSKGLHASSTKAFFTSFGLYNKDGLFNLLAYLLSDQNEIIIKVMRFAGNDKTIVDERMSFQGQSLILTVQNVLE